MISLFGVPVRVGALAEWAAALFSGATLLYLVVQTTSERRARRQREERAQASEVSAWFYLAKGERVWAALSNASKEPVYQVIVMLSAFQGAGPPASASSQSRSFLSTLPPGRFYVSMPWDGHATGLRFGFELCFTDAAGRHWVRHVDGQLDRIDKSPVAHYGFYLPLPWEYPQEDPPCMDPVNDDV